MSGVLSSKDLLEAYELMVRIRTVEETIGILLNEGLISGTAHLSIGQEAIPAGFSKHLLRDDTLTTTYRGHGWALAKGVTTERLLAELAGRVGGCCGGYGGSMHILDSPVGFLGASGIVGGGLPISVGAALAEQVEGRRGVSVSTFGDGATNIGTFHEALNVAAVWQLPVIFVCENNLYGEFTPAHETSRLVDLARRADAYGMPGVVVDGNDVEAVSDAAESAIDRARNGGGPTLIEAKTYRHRGHSRNDPARYRPPAEVEEWMAKDPIPRLRNRLESEVGWSLDQDQALRSRIDNEIGEAVAAVRLQAQPDPSRLENSVFTRAEGVKV